jgi:hypothetical protein
VDIITTEGERGVLKNLQRKATQADTMFNSLVSEMNRSMSIDRITTFTKQQEVPQWL